MSDFDVAYRRSQRIADAIVDIRKKHVPDCIFKQYLNIKMLWQYLEKHHCDQVIVNQSNVKLGSMINTHLIPLIQPAYSFDSYVYLYAKQVTDEFMWTNESKWAKYVAELFYDELVECCKHYKRPRFGKVDPDAYYDDIEASLKVFVTSFCLEMIPKSFLPSAFTIIYIVANDETIEETYHRNFIPGDKTYRDIVYCKRIIRNREYIKEITIGCKDNSQWIPKFKAHCIDNDIVLPW